MANYNKLNNPITGYNVNRPYNTNVAPPIGIGYKNNDIEAFSIYHLYMFGTHADCGYQYHGTDIGRYFQIDSFDSVRSDVSSIGLGGISTYPDGITVPDYLPYDLVPNYAYRYFNYYIADFYYTFWYSGATSSCTINTTGNNAAIFLNNAFVGVSPVPQTYQVTLQTGINYIKVGNYNTGGSGFVQLYIRDAASALITKTNTDWGLYIPVRVQQYRPFTLTNIDNAWLAVNADSRFQHAYWITVPNVMADTLSNRNTRSFNATFNCTFWYSGIPNANCYLYILRDDSGVDTITLNGSVMQFYASFAVVTTQQVTINSGVNYISVNISNTGGPSGFILAIHNTNANFSDSTQILWSNESVFTCNLR